MESQQIQKSSFKYAHLADLHLGSWRNPKLRQLSSQTFTKAINSCIENKVDFIIFAGDIFNNALPSIDIVNFLAKTLQKLKIHNIPLYVIPGSHDFSPTNRSMIDVLESAGLLINVCKGKVNKETKLLELNYQTDPKTNAKITGILGRRGMLDTIYYENLNREQLEQEPGYKIFMFHTTLTELKPKHLEMIDSAPATFLPKNQNYYAGGHIHHQTKVEITDYGTMTYTGALFPNNFAELEKYSHGGFYIIDVKKEKKEQTTNQSNETNKTTSTNQPNQNGQNNKATSTYTQNITFHDTKIKDHIHLNISATNKTPDDIKSEIQNHFQDKDIKDKIITIRTSGRLKSGKSIDLDWTNIFKDLEEKGAFVILKNDIKVLGEEYTEILQANSQETPANIEESLIKEHLGQFNTFKTKTELKLIQDLLNTLHTNKNEGEKNYDFETRIKDTIATLLPNTTTESIKTNETKEPKESVETLKSKAPVQQLNRRY